MNWEPRSLAHYSSCIYIHHGFSWRNLQVSSYVMINGRKSAQRHLGPHDLEKWRYFIPLKCEELLTPRLITLVPWSLTIMELGCMSIQKLCFMVEWLRVAFAVSSEFFLCMFRNRVLVTVFGPKRASQELLNEKLFMIHAGLVVFSRYMQLRVWQCP